MLNTILSYCDARYETDFERNRQIKPREEQNQNHRFNRWFAPPL